MLNERQRRRLIQTPWIALGVAIASIVLYVREVQHGLPNITDLQLYAFGAMSNNVHVPLWHWVVANFLHLSLVHIASNLLVLGLISIGVETLFGPVLTFLMVVAACFGAAYGAIVISSGHGQVSAGASGIVFAYIAAAAAADPRGRLGIGTYAWQLLILNLIITFAAVGISAGAHLGGLVVGGVVGGAWGLRFRRGQTGPASEVTSWQSFAETPANMAARRLLPIDRGRQQRSVLYTLLVSAGLWAFAVHSLTIGSAASTVIVALVFLLPVLGSAAALLPGASVFALEPDGIVVTRLWRTRRIGWHAIVRAEAFDPERGPIVVRAVTRHGSAIRLYTVAGMTVPELDTTLRTAHEAWALRQHERGMPLDQAPAGATGAVPRKPDAPAARLRLGEQLARRTVLGVTLGMVTAAVQILLAYHYGTLGA